MARYFLLVAVVLACLWSVRADGTCALTGLKPKMPSVTMPRCPEATKNACCGDCGDVSLIFNAMSADGVSIVNQIAPGAGSLLGKNTNFHVCDLFSNYAPCQFSIEALFCALECNPDSGSYVVKNSTAVTLNVCNTYAKEVFENCKKLSFPNLGQVSSFYNTPADFLDQIFAAVVRALGVNHFHTAVLPDASGMCYTGPKLVPTIPICCDSFDEAKKCPAGTIAKKYEPFVGQKVNETNCASFKGAVHPVVLPNTGNLTQPGVDNLGGGGIMPVPLGQSPPTPTPTTPELPPPTQEKAAISTRFISFFAVLAPLGAVMASLL